MDVWRCCMLPSSHHLDHPQLAVLHWGREIGVIVRTFTLVTAKRIRKLRGWTPMAIIYVIMTKSFIMYGDLGFIFPQPIATNQDLFHRVKVLLWATSVTFVPWSATRGYFLVPPTWSKGAWTGKGQGASSEMEATGLGTVNRLWCFTDKLSEKQTNDWFQRPLWINVSIYRWPSYCIVTRHI